MPTKFITSQQNIKTSDKDWTSYSLFLGGLDVTAGSLAQYDPLRTGYGRIFFIRKPKFLETLFTGDMKKYNSFFHMLEYGFTRIDGIQNTSLEFDQISGGYAGKSFEIPTVAKDDTNSLTLTVYEMAGSPIREFIDLWINGISDQHTGLTHYWGAISQGCPVSQMNHTAEAIYVATDSTGKSSGIEYSCLIANMIPKIVKKDHFNYESGSHQLVQYDIEFTATKYESQFINDAAAKLVSKQNILANYAYFDPNFEANANYEGNRFKSANKKPTSWSGAATHLSGSLTT